MNLTPRYVQIPYHMFVAMKPQLDSIPEKEFREWVEWGTDMCINGNMQPVQYMLGDMRLSDRFGYLYTLVLSVNAGVAADKAINSGT